MGKVAFMFPGQGAQYCGMGQDFYEKYPVAKEIFDLAGKVTGIDMNALVFEQNNDLGMTEYTQIAMVACEVAMLEVVKEMGILPDYSAGLSLGEYAALACANAVEYEDLFRLIRKRGLYMQNAYPTGGGMAAILGMDIDQIKSVLEGIPGEVSVANDNCPGQVVITGALESVEEAMKALSENGARRCVPLKVSGPFHSPLLNTAKDQLTADLQQCSFKDIQIPYLSNLTADVVTDANDIQDLLANQIVSPVRFRESILKLLDLGVTTFVEIGPGKTIQGFIKKTNRDVKVLNVEKVEDLEGLKNELC